MNRNKKNIIFRHYYLAFICLAIVIDLKESLIVMAGMFALLGILEAIDSIISEKLNKLKSDYEKKEEEPYTAGLQEDK